MNSIANHAREALLERRRVLHRIYRENAHERHRLDEEREADWPDQAAGTEAGAVLDRLSHDEQRELREIEAALQRIERGTYGICEVCGGAVGRHRLRALPEARLCIGCSEASERAF